MLHKTFKAPLTLCCFLMFAAGLLASQAQAQECSPSRTAGKWGFTTNGTVVGIGPRVSLGIFALDAEGNLQDGKATASLNGTVTDEAFSGTYSVNPDCTGKLAIEVFDPLGNKLFTATLDLVFDEDANEMRAMYTSAVTATGVALLPVISVEAKRISEPKLQPGSASNTPPIGHAINSSMPKDAPSTLTSTVTAPTVQLSHPFLLFLAPNPQNPLPPKCTNTTANPESVALTNLGPGVLHISGITISGPFSQTNTCGSSLGAGLSCNISVTWKKISGYGSLSIQDDGAGSPQLLRLSGFLGCPFQ